MLHNTDISHTGGYI